jgi:hypothetical protein
MHIKCPICTPFLENAVQIALLCTAEGVRACIQTISRVSWNAWIGRPFSDWLERLDWLEFPGMVGDSKGTSN